MDNSAGMPVRSPLPFVLAAALLAGMIWASGCGDGATEPAPAPPDPPRATTVTVTPGTTELTALGATVQLVAQVLDQNGQAMSGAPVSWTSTDASVATVDTSGLVTAAGNGASTITATAGSASGSAQVTVTQEVSAVTVTPAADTLFVGDTLRLTAEAADANGHAVAGAEFAWASQDTLVAVVGGAGLVTGIAAGEVAITATSSGVAGGTGLTVLAPVPTTVAVTPDTVALTAIGQTAQLAAEVRSQAGRVMTGVPVSWASGDTLVAKVDETGLVKAAGNGTTTITATTGSASGSAQVTVTQEVSEVTVTSAADTLVAGDTLRLTAEAADANGHAVAGAEFEWASSDTLVAVVDDTGLVTGMAAGEVEITAGADGVSGSASLTVLPNQPPVAVGAMPHTMIRGEEAMVDVTPYFNDPDGDSLKYSVATSDGAVAFGYAPENVVTIEPVAEGAATLTVTAIDPGGLSAVQTLRVSVPNQAPQALERRLWNWRLAVGETAIMNAAAYFVDPEDDALTYQARPIIGLEAATSVSVSGSTVTMLAVAEVEDGQLAVSASAGSRSAPTLYLRNVSIAAIAAPTHARYERRDSRILIEWKPTPGATHYNIYYDDFFDDGCRLSNGEPSFCEQLATNIQGTTYTHDTPDADSNYYWINACNSAGCSALQWVGPPSGASIGVARWNHNSFALRFEGTPSSPLAGFAAVSGYFELYRSISEDGTYQLVERVEANGPNVARSVDDDLQSDAIYYYKAKACNEVGCSELSAVAAGRTERAGPVSIPPIPTGLEGEWHSVYIFPSFHSSARVWWDAMPRATYYLVFRQGRLQARVDAPGTRHSSDLPGSFYVVACNKAGCSAPSAIRVRP